MGLKEMFGGKSDGPAYEPTREGFRPMMRDGRPVMLSELPRGMRQSTGQSTKPAPRAERKKRKEWGR